VPEPCGRTFEDALLSGYVDGALPQGDEQRVRVHLEDCVVCRGLVEEMLSVREVTMSTSFKVPEDLQWSERPRGAASRVSVGLGWTLAAIWMAALVVRGAWELWQDPPPATEALLAFGGVTALMLLFVGVLIDRIKASRSDRYKGVEK
jgi:anti-sigma factor RsiW